MAWRTIGHREPTGELRVWHGGDDSAGGHGGLGALRVERLAGPALATQRGAARGRGQFPRPRGRGRARAVDRPRAAAVAFREPRVDAVGRGDAGGLGERRQRRELVAPAPRPRVRRAGLVLPDRRARGAEAAPPLPLEEGHSRQTLRLLLDGNGGARGASVGIHVILQGGISTELLAAVHLFLKLGCQTVAAQSVPPVCWYGWLLNSSSGTVGARRSGQPLALLRRRGSTRSRRSRSAPCAPPPLVPTDGARQTRPSHR